MQPQSHRPRGGRTEEGRGISRVAAPVVAAACVVGFVVWLSAGSRLASRPGGGEPSAPGSAEGRGAAGRTDGFASGGADDDPSPARRAPTCVLPVAWRLAAVDPRFRLDEEEARRAIREAVGRWERAAGRPLFVEAAEGGLPIRFVYDERQARTEEFRAIERTFRERDGELERRRRELSARRARAEEASAWVAERTHAYEADLAAHDDRVRAWRDAGAAPGPLAEDLLAAERALARRRDALQTEGARVRAQRNTILLEADRLADALEERNREADLLERDHPASRIESAVYRTVVGQAPDGRAVLAPEIRVFVVSSPEDLVVALAHELGHAMGLGHATEPGAVMSAEHDRMYGTTVAGPGSADVALLREACGADA